MTGEPQIPLDRKKGGLTPGIFDLRRLAMIWALLLGQGTCRRGIQADEMVHLDKFDQPNKMVDFVLYFATVSLIRVKIRFSNEECIC